MVKPILLFTIFTAVLLFILIMCCAKWGYPLYATVLLNNVQYEGETLAKHYVEYLMFVVLPFSMVASTGITKLTLYFWNKITSD